jgi:hypothetical protein
MAYNNRSMSGSATMWERRCKKIAGMRDSTSFCAFLGHVLSRRIRRANCNDVSNFLLPRNQTITGLKDKDAVELMKLHKGLD